MDKFISPKIVIFVVTFFLLFLSISCEIYPSEDGKLIIVNASDSSLDKIVLVSCRLHGRSVWIDRWDSVDGKKKDENVSLFLPVGQYDVKIYVKRNIGYSYFETAFNQSADVVSTDVALLIFDGKNLYKP